MAYITTDNSYESYYEFTEFVKEFCPTPSGSPTIKTSALQEQKRPGIYFVLIDFKPYRTIIGTAINNATGVFVKNIKTSRTTYEKTFKGIVIGACVHKGIKPVLVQTTDVLNKKEQRYTVMPVVLSSTNKVVVMNYNVSFFASLQSEIEFVEHDCSHLNMFRWEFSDSSYVEFSDKENYGRVIFLPRSLGI